MAFGTGTINSAAGAVSDLFAEQGLRYKAQGNRIEAQEYGLAAGLSRENEQFSKTSTAIKDFQTSRSIEQTLGGQQADIAANGFGASGSSLDLLRDSASQGALTKATLQQQGVIEQDSYEEQAKSYDLMQQSSLLAAHAADKAATGATITGVIKGVSAVASLFL